MVAKRVRSKDDLTRLALERGASVKGAGGKMINASRSTTKLPPKQAAAKPVATEEPKPTPAPAPTPGPDPAAVALGQQLEQVAIGIEGNNMVIRDVVKQMQGLAETSKPVSRWVFDVERDDDGFIERIVATNVSVN